MMTSTLRSLALLTLSTTLATGCLADGDAPTDLATTSLDSRGPRGPSTYLALGDSIAFGFNPLLLADPAVEPSAFVGYPEHLDDDDDRLRNASCPGETSASFRSSTAPDNGCRDFKTAFGLHVDYDGTQLEYAVGHLATNRTSLVTFAIGANDLLMVLSACAGDAGCALAQLPATLQQVGGNAATSLGTIRAAGYTGRLVVLSYYPRNYNDPLSVGAISALNNVLAQVAASVGAEVADGFDAFATASAPFGGDPCAAGLLIRLPDGTCDQHPSRSGQRLLARTVDALIDE